jgi:uncharacterized membrane protein
MLNLGPLQILVLVVMAFVALVFLAGLATVFLKYSRDRDKWNDVEKERVAREERWREEHS